ncbi:ribonucleoside-diphosphate reductase large subunit [Agrobacterium phage Atu_ph07]|uniref:Ribonucleotide reductase of class Ia (Aerobic) n=1 Tax=Agrobacterium phage Atu_ph07 TaxID=2024264 RepID=A0A223W070_9CAUD|nr:ribonucleoside-diphosphate reductase large subunit [Agrobacterium phage Atu_ph07]ASV44709.1 ribonucleotide reductase of class Ia (aerobic) [Agrobacterium phage Atu_ph07]
MTYWLNEDSRLFLSRGYLKEGETAEMRIRVIAEAAEKYLNKPGFADKIEDYILKGWLSLSSPIWSNFGNERGLPISCNNSVMSDDIESILDKTSEIAMMTKMGAGTSLYMSHLRPRGAEISAGGTSNGPVHFMGMIQEVTDIISQSNVRRGSCAVYLDVEHPDIEEFLECREEGNHIQHLSLGVCISRQWFAEMKEGDKKKRKIWLRILRKRSETGYPYLFFKDNVNDNKPQVYKDKGMEIVSSNLCNEIYLHSDAETSFVCNLLSLNALHWDEWKDTDLPEVVTYFLDAVMSEYIEKIRHNRFMKAALKFATEQRALGIGVLGWHSYLQSKMIPFESAEAKRINIEMFKTIQEKTHAASRKLAVEYGEPELLKGYGMRNVTTMAVAPTTSSSAILGQVSPSIEPENSNYYTKSLAKGKFTYRNPYLKKLLGEKGKDNETVWKSILNKAGSVQHLEFLSEHEKAVFRTFGEISQFEVITQAADRQKFIDQGQSLNLMIHPDTPIKDINKLIIAAEELGLKGLYYQRSTSPTAELNRKLVACVSCEA